MQNELQKTETMMHTTKVDKQKRIKKDLDINVVSAKTIEALLRYLGIEPEEHPYALDNKLNQKRIEIQGQKPNKIKKSLKPSSKFIEG